MHRRSFFAFPLLGYTIAQAAAAPSEQRITLDHVDFRWWHEGNRLHGKLSAPTHGWLAVGFNDEPKLQGTRFVIAVVDGGLTRAELHIADPPNHRSIEVLGGRSDIRNLKGEVEGAQSKLAFSLPHRSTDRFSVDLLPGRSIHIMLAWSNEADFNHHSAWRRHVDVIL